MTLRQLTAGLLAAASFGAFSATAGAAPTPMSQPLPEPARSAGFLTASTAMDSLLIDLRAEYAASHRRSVHNEIVLMWNVPASAVL